MYDLNVYAGGDSEIRGSTLGGKVVFRMVESIREPTVMIAFDRFFASFDLMRLLLFPSVGTVHSSRKRVPKFTTKHADNGSLDFLGSRDGVLCVRWKGSKEVIALSNCHSNTVTKVTRASSDGTDKDIDCPDAIACYNSIMGGVDLADQKASIYNPDRKSTKWWRRVFYKSLINATINAWIISQEARGKKIPLRKFLVPLSEQLIAAGILKASVKRRYRPCRPSKRFLSMTNVGGHMPYQNSTRRRCALCASVGTEKRTKVTCEACEAPLCIDCFIS